MAFTYNMEKDLRFQEGRKRGKQEGKEEGKKEGKEEGKEEGKQEGKQEANTKAILVLSKMGTNDEQIAQYLDISIDFVKKVLSQNK